MRPALGGRSGSGSAEPSGAGGEAAPSSAASERSGVQAKKKKKIINK